MLSLDAFSRTKSNCDKMRLAPPQPTSGAWALPGPLAAIRRGVQLLKGRRGKGRGKGQRKGGGKGSSLLQNEIVRTSPLVSVLCGSSLTSKLLNASSGKLHVHLGDSFEDEGHVVEVEVEVTLAKKRASRLPSIERQLSLYLIGL